MRSFRGSGCAWRWGYNFAFTLIAGTAFAAGSNGGTARKSTPKFQVSLKPAQKPTVHPEKKPKAVGTQAPPPVATEGTFGPARLIRQVRATDPNGAALGEVPALVVNDGYLLLPLAFVSNVTVAQSGGRFFVEDSLGKISQEIFLSDLDLDSGLALYRGPNKIIPSFPLAKVREVAPVPNDPLTSVVGLNRALPGARFLKSKPDVSTVKYQVSLGSAANTGVVSYLFNREAQLVAVAMGEERDGGTWSASGKAVAALIRRASLTPAPASANPTFEMRRRQLQSWQDRWTQSLAPAKGGLVTRFLDCHPYNPSIEDAKLAVRVHRVEAKNCESRFSLPLGGGYEAGIEYQVGEVYLKPSFAQIRELALISAAFGSRLFGEFSRSTASVNQLTTADCQEIQTTNSSGRKVNVKFCTSALKTEPGLNDTSIAVASPDSNWTGVGSHVNVAAVRLKGFGQVQTRRVLEAMIENPSETK